MQVMEYSKQAKHNKPKQEIEDLIKKMRKEDEKLVKGKFEFVEADGGFFEFTYRFYPGLIQKFTLIHGEICDLPLGLVKHLNNTYHKIRKYMNVEQPSNGAIVTPMTFETRSRIRFVPVDFL